MDQQAISSQHTCRPTDERRPNYQAAHPSEHFLIPLLSSLIQSGIANGASHLTADPTALDVGCGAQPFRLELERAGYKYVGIDVVQNRKGTVDQIAAIDRPLPPDLCARGPFNLILCTEVLEHVADWSQAFANFSSLLAPRGRVIITCPFVYPLHEELYDFWRPTDHALRHFATSAGLTVDEITRGGGTREALYTLLALTQFVGRSQRLRDRVYRKAVAGVLRLLGRLLRSPGFARRIDVQGGLYLTNFAVFSKPL